ncbi:MAG TPA: peptide-methionine (S)-S-oxide reductase MsrA [Limnochordia bacterium]
MERKKAYATAVLGGGCFWCLEPIFAMLEGVVSVEPGYSGGHVPNPTYEEVCTQRTGHAEVVRITFDPAVITFEDLLRVFFTVHDPTTPDRQGPDVGPQYRSVIFYTSEEQKRAAEAVIDECQREGLYEDPIVTEVSPLVAFYPAEAYHRNYFGRNPYQPYCQLVIAPKVAAFRERFASRLRR